MVFSFIRRKVRKLVNVFLKILFNFRYLQMSIEIIPAIDILHGKCVRLTQGDYDTKKIYNEHPLEVARQFEDAGLKRLHLVDLDGAKEGRVKNWNVLETYCRENQP